MKIAYFDYCDSSGAFFLEDQPFGSYCPITPITMKHEC